MNILLVEDDQDTRIEISELLHSLGHDTIDSGCAEEALQFLRTGRMADLIIFDINMPGTSGLDMIKEVRQNVVLGGNTIPAICMTGTKDAELVVELLRTGINDFLFKPLNVDPLKSSLQKVEHEISRVRSEESEAQALSHRLEQKSLLLEELSLELSETQAESLLCLAYAAEYKDLGAGAHLRRIGAYAERMGELLGWSADRCSTIALAAPLHDVGKIGIPDHILNKTGKLTAQEFNCIKTHTTLGSEILSASKSPVMRLGAKIAHSHHENFDGSGYPNGLVGNQIPIEAMITTLVDVYDALRTSRPYRKALDHAGAIDTLCNGDERTDISKFDPNLLQTFLRHHYDFSEIYRKNSDTHTIPVTLSASSH